MLKKRVNYVAPVVDWSFKSLTEKLARLIELQSFDGSWPGSEEIASILGFKEGVESKEGVDKGFGSHCLWLSGLRLW